MNDKMAELLKTLDDQQLQILATEAQLEIRERSRKVDLADITPDKMRDPEFAAQVRAEVDRALREAY
jgi:hypothetical protein